MVKLKSDETLDDLIINGLKIIQKNKGFRFTLDSILLAHFATVKEGDKIVDLGTGTGIIPLILSTRANKLQILGIDIQEEIVEMAYRSVYLNSLEDKISIYQADIREIDKKLKNGFYQLVTVNPPYWKVNEGKTSELQSRAFSRHEVNCGLDDIIFSAAKLLNNQGRLALIHRTERLSDIFALMRQYRLEPRRVRFIHSFIHKGAKHVLVEARKNVPPDLKVLPPLIVYESPGKYSLEVLQWYGKEGE